MQSDHSKVIASISPRILCKSCNHRFDPDMAAAYPILLSLIGGTARSISRSQRKILVRYFQRLGIMADIATSDEQIEPAYRETAHFRANARWRVCGPTYSLEERELFARAKKGGAAPKVWIGHHLGILGVDMEVHSNGTAKIEAGAFRSHSKRFHVVVGELAVAIYMGEVPPMYTPKPPWVRLDGHATAIAWPPSRSVDYNDFLRLLAPDPEVFHLAMMLNEPADRAMYEEERLRRAGPYAEAAQAHRAERAAAVAALRGL